MERQNVHTKEIILNQVKGATYYNKILHLNQ